MEGHFLGPKSPSTTPSRAAQSPNKKDFLVVLVLVSMRNRNIFSKNVAAVVHVRWPRRATSASHSNVALRGGVLDFDEVHADRQNSHAMAFGRADVQVF